MSHIKVLEYDNEDGFVSTPYSSSSHRSVLKHEKVMPSAEYTISSDTQSTIRKKPVSTRHGTGVSSSLVEKSRYYCVVMPRRVLKDLFLPIGYPHSVREEYMSYQIFDSIQGLFTYLRGVVATSAVLTAAGVGDAEATAMSAAMTWAMRDGSGMVGGLLFSYSASSMFDSHVKEFRLFADVMNDIGLTLDMVAPYVGPNNILYLTSLATVCKVMCGISAGSTKGSVTHHFALRGNMADLNAKESTQETLVSLVGMLLGVALARYLHRLEQAEQENATPNTSASAAMVSWTIFVVLTVLHIWANYVGVKKLHLRTLNRQRATVALKGIIRGVTGRCTRMALGGNDMFPTSKERLLSFISSPQNVSESLWKSLYNLLFPGDVRLGVRLQDTFAELSNDEMMHYLQNEFTGERYVVTLVGTRPFKVCVTLNVGASDADELKAFLHAMVLREWVNQGALNDKSDAIDRRNLIATTHKELNAIFNNPDKTKGDKPHSILDVLKDKGWDVQSRLYLGFGKWRISWSTEKRE